jgi:cob(I)alamin adenosyltransferase
MVVLNKIYTKTGDAGETALGDGSRVAKHSLRVTAYGTVDELNSTLGLARLHADDALGGQLSTVQNDLFDLGADLCTRTWRGTRSGNIRRCASWSHRWNALSARSMR